MPSQGTGEDRFMKYVYLIRSLSAPEQRYVGVRRLRVVTSQFLRGQRLDGRIWTHEHPLYQVSLINPAESSKSCSVLFQIARRTGMTDKPLAARLRKLKLRRGVATPKSVAHQRLF